VAIEKNKADGIQSFSGGMDQSLPPSFLDKDKSYKNINVSLRNGKVSPRPKLIERFWDLGEYEKESPLLGSLYHSHNVSSGRIQHSGRFKTSLGEYVILVINGVIYAGNRSTFNLRPLGSVTDPKSANFRAVRLYGHQAYTYYVIYDWPNNVIIIDNDLNVRRASSLAVEIPRSYLGAFVHNRLFVANKGIEFGASDPVSPDNPYSPLTFLDSIVTDTNPSPAFPDQFFSLSYIDRLSSITAMGYFEKSSTSIGFGPLFVATKEAIYVYNVNAPREDWAKSVFGSVMVHNIGIVGPKAHMNVGGDIWYRGPDGSIYSLAIISSDQQKWGVTNISREIEDSLYTVNKHLLPFSTMEYHDNTILTQLRPYATKALNIMGMPIDDYVFNGLGALELNTISGIKGGSNPIWASLYSVVTTDMVKLDDGILLVGKAKHDDTKNAFYMLERDANVDYYGLTRTPVKSRIYTREFNMESSLQDKLITHINLDIREIEGPIKVSIHVKSGREWVLLGSIDADTDSLQDELIAISQPLQLKTITLRIDIEGYYYEFYRAYVVGEVYTDLQPKRDFEEIECISEQEFIGDMDI